MFEAYLEHYVVGCANSRREVLQNQRGTNKTIRSFGRIESVGYKVSEIVGINKTGGIRGAVCIFAADHGVSELGLSIFPQSQTKKIVELIEEGHTPINKIAKRTNVPLFCLDIGIVGPVRYGSILQNHKVVDGTRNMMLDDAMTEDEVIRSFETGMRFANKLKSQRIDIVAAGEVGIGNTISSSIITAVLCNKEAYEITDVGTGIDNDKLEKKREIVKTKIDELRSFDRNLTELLKKAGGAEICAEAGFILECARLGMAVILDGFISGVAALIACEMKEDVRKCIIPSHISSEKGHRYIFEKLRLEPIVDWGMHYGIASGAAMILPVVMNAYDITNE